MQYVQSDMFAETLEKKIHRLEKWIYRLQKEMWFLKGVYELKKQAERQKPLEESQMVLFKS